MSPATLEPPKPRIVPVRACGRCAAVDDVFHLTMVGRTWMCRACYRTLRYPAPSTPEVAGAAREPLDLRLQRVDGMLRWGGVAARIAIYAGFLALTAVHPLAENLLLGFFAADAFGWMLHAWWDARFHARAVTVEALLYTALFVGLDRGGMLAMPDDVAARFLAGGTASLTLGLHWARFWCKLNVRPA